MFSGTEAAPPQLRAQATIDLDAYRDNLRLLAASAPGAALMAVVKADAYGHGLLECARAARQVGAQWLGVALLQEARELRQAGDSGRILAWLGVPGDDWAGAVADDIDVSVNAEWAINEVADAARRLGRRARVHLHVDTGLGREGAAKADWPSLFATAKDLVDAGHIEVAGLWSHVAHGDSPGHEAIASQQSAFDESAALAFKVGLGNVARSFANTALTMTRPSAHFDVVRVGIASHGIAPGPGVGDAATQGFRPVMRLSARIASVKRVPAGHGVSYDHTYVTDRETTLALVPLGYADGIPRAASNRAPVSIGGQRHRIAGRVCMDQFVVDVGDQSVAPGDEAVLFGDPVRGEPSVEEWATACDTIAYEIVTRVGPRVPRVHLGRIESEDHGD